jgi:hypothetical protein
MQILESLEAHITEKLPTGWQAHIEQGSQLPLLGYPPVIRISHAGRNLHPPLSLMLADDEIDIYADKDSSHGLYRTYGAIGRYFLTDPTSIDDILATINLRLLDYI